MGKIVKLKNLKKENRNWWRKLQNWKFPKIAGKNLKLPKEPSKLQNYKFQKKVKKLQGFYVAESGKISAKSINGRKRETFIIVECKKSGRKLPKIKKLIIIENYCKIKKVQKLWN